MLRTHAGSQQAHFSPKNLCAQRVLQKNRILAAILFRLSKKYLTPG